MPASRRRAAHVAPRPVSRLALPAVLLGAIGAGLGGMALTGQPVLAPVTAVVAAASVSAEPLNEAQLLHETKETAGAAALARPPVREPARASRSRTKGPIWSAPLGTGRLTSRFGWRWGRAHQGVDIAVPTGTTVRAVGAGRVLTAGWSSGYGRLVTVEHDDGTVTAYAHLSAWLVNAGDRVAAGSPVARSGNTGRSTGPHLHFEVRKAGGQVNPIAWLWKHGIRL